MLTPQDLKQIAKLFEPMFKRLDAIERGQIQLQKDITNLQKDMKVVRRDIQKIIKNQQDDFDYMDRSSLFHEQRIKRIENQLDLPHS